MLRKKVSQANIHLNVFMYGYQRCMVTATCCVGPPLYTVDSQVCIEITCKLNATHLETGLPTF